MTVDECLESFRLFIEERDDAERSSVIKSTLPRNLPTLTLAPSKAPNESQDKPYGRFTNDIERPVKRRELKLNRKERKATINGMEKDKRDASSTDTEQQLFFE